MTSRIVAIGMLVAFLGIVGAFMAIAVVGPRTGLQSAVTDREPIIHTQDMGRWRLQGQLALASTGAYELAFRLLDRDGARTSPPSSPTVRVLMLDHNMGAIAPPVEPVGLGSYRAVGTLNMEGHWRFLIEVAGDQAEMAGSFRR